ncbi:unnamed protein product [Trichogramma brassicae]|uniref:Uncharacterized protein n=1 Tax=Trichogramma brassicae TaxID=86971 RepID=A0A6H5IXW2_9HYME|nr:unnamed protein product [Trichogramma brassicae]
MCVLYIYSSSLSLYHYTAAKSRTATATPSLPDRYYSAASSLILARAAKHMRVLLVLRRADPPPCACCLYCFIVFRNNNNDGYGIGACPVDKNSVFFVPMVRCSVKQLVFVIGGSSNADEDLKNENYQVKNKKRSVFVQSIMMCKKENVLETLTLNIKKQNDAIKSIVVFVARSLVSTTSRFRLLYLKVPAPQPSATGRSRSSPAAASIVAAVSFSCSCCSARDCAAAYEKFSELDRRRGCRTVSRGCVRAARFYPKAAATSRRDYHCVSGPALVSCGAVYLREAGQSQAAAHHTHTQPVISYREAR